MSPSERLRDLVPALARTQAVRDALEQIAAAFDARERELLDANNREVERRRSIEARERAFTDAAATKLAAIADHLGIKHDLAPYIPGPEADDAP